MWHTAALMRAKDFPSLDKLRDAAVPRKRISISDTEAAIAYVRSVGGTVTITKH